jgi:bifunctional non-homologous end joining protein LigD
MKFKSKEPQKITGSLPTATEQSKGSKLSPGEIEVHNQLAAKQNKFAMKKHHASRLHYDLRLAHNGVLKSWVVPAGPSHCPEDQREAIQVEDHSVEYAFSERVIHEGPGTGTVMLWDWGTWEPLDGYTDVDKSLRRGLLKFFLHAEKLKGTWILRRVSHYDGNQRNPHWVLTKERDAFARSKTEKSILDEAPNSISTGRTLEEIAEDSKPRGKRKNKLQREMFDDDAS